MDNYNEMDRPKYFKELINIVIRSDLSFDDKKYVIAYLNDIKNRQRDNDFYDADFLWHAIINLLSFNTNSYGEIAPVLDNMCSIVKKVLPKGMQTPKYEEIKNILLNCGFKVYRSNAFNEELYALFDDPQDYLQIASIIADNPILQANMDAFVLFSITLGKEIDDQKLLKREIITYLHNYANIEDDEDYLNTRVKEIKMRYGVYPGIDEKTLATVYRELEKINGLLLKLEIASKKIDEYLKKADYLAESGIKQLNDCITQGKNDIELYANDSIKKMQTDLSVAKASLLEELSVYLQRLEDTMKENSDQVFNQMLLDAKDKLEQIKGFANSLSVTTAKDLLRIQAQTNESLEQLKNYVSNNPDLKKSIEYAEENRDIMEALLKIGSNSPQTSGEVTSPVIVQPQEIIVPENQDFLVPKFTMTDGILPTFNRSTPYSKRMKAIEDKITELECQGYIIPQALYDALPWYLMGNKIVYLYGPTQSGKTTMADLIVKVVGSELLSGGKITDEYSITSYNDVRGIFDENALFYSLYYGKTIFYDEIDNGNPDNLVVLGTYISDLISKINHPERDVRVQFAKRRFVPVNPNARILTAGNTSGKGKNQQFTARNRMDESFLERIVPIRVIYDSDVEKKIFGKNAAWYEFFNLFREMCSEYAKANGMESVEGNVTTGDAAAIVECISEQSMDIYLLMNSIFVQTKGTDYLSFLCKKMKDRFHIVEMNTNNYNNKPLSDFNTRQIVESFVYTAQNAMEDMKRLRVVR